MACSGGRSINIVLLFFSEHHTYLVLSRQNKNEVSWNGRHVPALYKCHTYLVLESHTYLVLSRQNTNEVSWHGRHVPALCKCQNYHVSTTCQSSRYMQLGN